MSCAMSVRHDTFHGGTWTRTLAQSTVFDSSVLAEDVDLNDQRPPDLTFRWRGVDRCRKTTKSQARWALDLQIRARKVPVRAQPRRAHLGSGIRIQRNRFRRNGLRKDRICQLWSLAEMPHWRAMLSAPS